MQFYCKKCYIVNDENWCRACGKKNLQEANKDDFCFLIEMKTMYGEMFKGLLKEQGIPCADYPSGNGMRTQFALKLENIRLFVPFEFLDEAKELYNSVFLNLNDEEN